MKKIAFYILLIIIWELVYRLGVDVFKVWKAYSFPSPLNVLKSIYVLMEEKILWIAVLTSMKRLLIGYAISLVVGLALGLVIVRYKYIDENLTPLILGLQTLPSVCWIPFAILWYGISEESIIFVIAMGSMFAISIATESAIKNIQPLYTKAARTMGAKGMKLYFNVTLPAALPTIVSGLKQGWSFAWRALISGEMISATKGLGHVLMVGRDLADIGQVVAVMLIIIALGLLLDKAVFGKIEASIRQRWGLEANR
ncbi:aliphatic sulfonates ABC transporter permease protein SsuC [Gottschalkia purinilytica]|uniref:Aliphatic sulfonates ABC transporter permease protein SsuC n=1 Tax=Gottschalkia purinilytica TaxID=1503 RepID=A0A0L0W776_GOTPU|nr:aliphatic sulfonates ABC transporter permease protein SsuC [Gottschalkia purinilytica]